ncbi:hypothetical protein LDJ79_06270 [Vibrio tritonius]|uniref:Glycosyl transferase n=1 Tax=Vibrio tritonius TaxID=1435069 RepID=A0ABS7YJ50_9VIBR|nr:glycosyltransferase family 9 protein [Vibrio tritonius]MCA2015708.1 hypothetical protein [Vibrio tritonius]
MLSPLIILINKLYNVTVISDYPNFLNISDVEWVSYDNLDKGVLESSILVSPTPAFSNVKYCFKAKFYLGYFESFNFVSNFSSESYHADIRADHYFEKCFVILKVLNVDFEKNDLPYPNLTQINDSTALGTSENEIATIAPYSNWEERQLPYSKYLKLIRQLIETGFLVYIIGSDKNDEVSLNKKLCSDIGSYNVINLTGKTTLSEMIFLMQKSKFYFGNDSGPSHLSYLMPNLFSYVFFGCVLPETRIPLNVNLKKSITTIDSRISCPLYPCYNGYSKPNCKLNCVCLHDIDINQISTKFIKDISCVEY